MWGGWPTKMDGSLYRVTHAKVSFGIPISPTCIYPGGDDGRHPGLGVDPNLYFDGVWGSMCHHGRSLHIFRFWAGPYSWWWRERQSNLFFCIVCKEKTLYVRNWSLLIEAILTIFGHCIWHMYIHWKWHLSYLSFASYYYIPQCKDVKQYFKSYKFTVGNFFHFCYIVLATHVQIQWNFPRRRLGRSKTPSTTSQWCLQCLLKTIHLVGVVRDGWSLSSGCGVEIHDPNRHYVSLIATQIHKILG